jgi:predicted dehydrogenase
MDRLNQHDAMDVALIGYGYWGKIIEKYLRASEKFHLVLVFSPHLECSDIYTDNISRIYDNKEIEAVFICSPLSTHFEYCKEFLLRGKHVFCEKPTTEHLEEFSLLSDIAIKNHKVLLTDYTYTVSRSINTLKASLTEIGMVSGISCRICQYGKFYQNESVYTIIGSHMIAAVMYILEKYPLRVSHTNINKDRYGFLKMEFAGPIQTNIECNLLSPDRERKIVIYGENGILVFDMSEKYTVKKYITNDNTISVHKQYIFDETNNIILILHYFFNLIVNENYHSNLRLSGHVIEILEKII